jgi:hypothetical protein
MSSRTANGLKFHSLPCSRVQMLPGGLNTKVEFIYSFSTQRRANGAWLSGKLGYGSKGKYSDLRLSRTFVALAAAILSQRQLWSLGGMASGREKSGDGGKRKEQRETNGTTLVLLLYVINPWRE